MDNQQITKELSDRVRWFKNALGLELTLSEIISLRRYITESDEMSRTTTCVENQPTTREAIGRLLADYYGIDWTILPIIGVPSHARLVVDRDDPSKVMEGFKDYLRKIQRESYIP